MLKRFNGVKFNRNELSGAFGDIGTDFPLIVGMILAAGLDSPSVLIMFGIMQIFTGFFYKMPMPVQPLKAMAAIVISGGAAGAISANVLSGAGLSIGITVFILTVTRLIDFVNKIVPKCVVRGIQFGLGIQLAMMIAIKKYIFSDGSSGIMLALISFLIIIFLKNSRKYPAALFVIILGIIYASLFKPDAVNISSAIGINLPKLSFPSLANIMTGFIVLTLPQLPLSIGNSILATGQLAKDYFPGKNITVRKIGFTYSLTNIVSSFFSGIPVCHGSGGMAGHYTFGARTGGSVIIYGLMYLLFGLFLGNGFEDIANIFPLPALGVILFFEGVALLLLISDIGHDKIDLTIAIIVGIIAGGVDYGFLIGMVVGTSLYYLIKSKIIKGFIS